MTDKLDHQINELEKKIAVERKVKLGADNMKAMLKDKNALAQVEISIGESQKRLDFLEDQMIKLVAKKDGGKKSPLKSPTSDVSSAGKSTSPTDERRMSQGSLVPSEGGITNQPKPGFFRSLMRFGSKSGHGPTSTASSISVGQTQASSRNDSLTTVGGMKRQSYSSLEMSRTSTALTAEKIAVKLQELQGKMEVEQRLKAGFEKVAQAFENRSDISSQEKKSLNDAVTKLKEALQRIALLKTSIQRYQGMHVEGLADLSEMDTEAPKKTITTTLKIRILQIRNLMGKKSSKNEAYVDIRVDSLSKFKTKIRSKLSWEEDIAVVCDKSAEIEFLVYDRQDGLLAMLFFKLSDLENIVKNNAELSENETASDSYESEWALEPAGEIRLRFNFPKKTSKGATDGKIQRTQGVRKRKVYQIKGHRFIPGNYYQIMKCSYCSEYLTAGKGFQCESCRLFCHERCHKSVPNKCITLADDEAAKAQKSAESNKPHKFDRISSVVPSWCNHCGYMLPLTKKGYEKCKDCALLSHVDCKVYFPNACGIKLMPHTQSETKLKPTAASKYSSEITKATELRPSKETAIDRFVDSIGHPGARRPSLDDFHFIAVLGKGNFGKVMLAEEKGTKQLYAIKVLKKEFILQNDEIESTRSEKRVFMAINRERHPFLVGLHSCFQTETRIYFVMEYVSGGDLMLHIQRQQFTEKRAKFYACEVLLALEYFHKNNITYRDLKLDNILLTLDGHIKLADYGLCKENMPIGSTTNTFCGTPEFMAPEILLGQEYTRAVDWWAFGVLIYEMLLGQSPFKGQDEDEIFEAIIEDEVLYPVNMPKDSVSIIQKLLTKDPTKRLGAGATDSDEIKSQPFFRGVSWDDMIHKKVPSPYVPTVTHEKDVSNFDEEFTRELPVLTPIQTELQEADQEEFKGFTYVAEWVISGSTFNAATTVTTSQPKTISSSNVDLRVAQNGPQSSQNALPVGVSDNQQASSHSVDRSALEGVPQSTGTMPVQLETDGSHGSIQQAVILQDVQTERSSHSLSEALPKHVDIAHVYNLIIQDSEMNPENIPLPPAIAGSLTDLGPNASLKTGSLSSKISAASIPKQIPGNLTVKKQQTQIQQVLESKKVTFKLVDVAADEKAKETMKAVSGSPVVPQIHVDGKFKGASWCRHISDLGDIHLGYEAFSDANEGGELNDFFGVQGVF